jgi:alkylhydroperoxidase family enzyme
LSAQHVQTLHAFLQTPSSEKGEAMLIHPLTDAEVPQTLRPYAVTTSTNMVIHGLGRRPDTLKQWLDFYWELTRQDGSIALELKELIRHQIAALYQCGLCSSYLVPTAREREISLDKAQCVLEPDERFSDAERAMLDFTRRIFLGPEHINQEAFAQMRHYFSEEQITEIGFIAAMFTGWGRLTFGFDVVNDDEAHRYEIRST